ncbi:hypothetical protein [Azospirillum soli]|uniref:hypothetical protein n=1 Tax=Azospirillum soli TaxID=1304799 RepID=UPI001FE3C1EC|nr:hypothetical protein [Azospirillum soli]MBP2312006.1 hypothetical protein [Azospirillum soli]
MQQLFSAAIIEQRVKSSLSAMTDRFQYGARALMCALLPVFLAAGPAAANEKGAGGGGCPWIQDVTLDVGGKTLTVGQGFFTSTGEPLEQDGYHVYPLVNQLKLRIVGPHGEEWEAGLTRLTGGKRCNAFYVGKPVQVSDSENDGRGLILTR